MVMIAILVFKCESNSDKIVKIKTDLSTPQAGDRAVNEGYMVNTVAQQPFSPWVIWTSLPSKLIQQ
jgi:hypothetical protein